MSMLKCSLSLEDTFVLTIDELLALDSAGFIPLAADATVGKLAARASASRSPLERWWYGSRSGSTPAVLLRASLREGDFRDRERDNKRGLSAGPLGIVPQTPRVRAHSQLP